MVDSINRVSGSNPTQRPQATAATGATRSVSVLNATQQKTRQSSGSNAAQQALKVFSVPQTQTAGNAPTSTKVPRGSLVDTLV